jgi:hypothetical protein
MPGIDRLCRNEKFLKTLIRSRKQLYKNIITSCSTDNLMSVVEVITNVFAFELPQEESRLLKSYENIRKYFASRPALNENLLRTYFVSQEVKIKFLVAFTLQKVLEHSLICLLNEDAPS